MKIDLQANYILVLGETLVSWGEAVFNECRSKEIPQAFFNGCRNNVLDYFRTDEEFEGARLTGRFTYEYDEDGLSIREVYDDLFSIGEAIGAVTVSGQQIITLVQELRKGMVESEFDDSSFVLGMIYPEVFTQEQQKNGFFFHATDDKAQISVCAILTNCDFQKIGTSYGLVILSLFPETEIQNMNLFPSGALTMLSEGDRGSLDSLGKDIIALEKFSCEKVNVMKADEMRKKQHRERKANANESQIQTQKDELKSIGIKVVEDNGKPFPPEAIKIIKDCHHLFPDVPQKGEAKDPPTKFYAPVCKKDNDRAKCNKNAYTGPQFTVMYNKTAYRIGYSLDTDRTKRLWVMKGTLDKNGKWNSSKSLRYFYHHDMLVKKKKDAAFPIT